MNINKWNDLKSKIPSDRQAKLDIEIQKELREIKEKEQISKTSEIPITKTMGF